MQHLFVSYEIAKQLKDKGFDEPCNAFYQEYAVGKTMYWNFIKYLNYNLNPNRCSAPIHQQVIDWFRDKHGIWIEIETIFFDGTDLYTPFIKGGFKQIELECEGDYYDALNKAIEEALKLIKKL